MLIVALALFALLLILISAALGTYWYLRQAAALPALPSPARPGRALLALNLQQCYLKDLRSNETQRTLVTLNQTAKSAYQQGLCVLFSQQIYQSLGARWMANLFWRGDAVAQTPGLRLDPRVAATGQIVASEQWDVFHQSSLPTALERAQVGTLLVCGFSAHASFYHTVASALRQGYRVILLEPAIISPNAQQWQRLRQKLHSLGAESSQASQ